VFDVNTTPTSGTLSYRVRMVQPNPDLVLRGGMLVDVTTQTGHSANALIVPSGAITTGPKGPMVFTVVAGKAKSVPVSVGLQTDTQSEIRGAGLNTATVVITAQPNGLHDGSTVSVPGAGGATGAKPAAATN
jgi:multidrug efflux pump subunit AcrA (membrane-fusion protein)